MWWRDDSHGGGWGALGRPTGIRDAEVTPRLVKMMSISRLSEFTFLHTPNSYEHEDAFDDRSASWVP